MTAPHPPRTRRTWPQRFLLLAGLLLAAGCFAGAKVFWDARTVLAELPRIRVGADVLAQPGSPGDPVNFLLVGIDSSEGLDPDDPVRNGRDVDAEANGRFLSDTILLLRLDPSTGDAAVLSIPRDLYVEVSGASKPEWKINSTLLIGGMDKLIETINANLDVEVNHFVMVDFAGFADLVELVGGVPVYFPYATRDAGSGLVIREPGCWVLNGNESLAYVRARTLEENIDGEWTRLATPAPDLARIERQQEFMVLALEQALELGGADLTRVREFVEVGAQAVQLDETITAGELLDLASAFREYDTDALRVATLPVSPLFDSEGAYLGEGLELADAVEILDVFQGEADGVRPSQVTVEVVSDDEDQRDRVLDQLVARRFVASASDGETPLATTLRVPVDQLDEAVIVARYLEIAPQIVVEDSEVLTLLVGTDFAGVRSFPRPDAEVRSRVADALAQISSEITTTTADPVAADDVEEAESPPQIAEEPTNSSSPSASEVPNDTTTAFSPPTTAVILDETVDPETPLGPTTTIERGRPPQNVLCVPTGG